jgi:hypothetical protein
MKKGKSLSTRLNLGSSILSNLSGNPNCEACTIKSPNTGFQSQKKKSSKSEIGPDMKSRRIL